VFVVRQVHGARVIGGLGKRHIDRYLRDSLGKNHIAVALFLILAVRFTIEVAMAG
jgi:hypothetical protein